MSTYIDRVWFFWGIPVSLGFRSFTMLVVLSVMALPGYAETDCRDLDPNAAFASQRQLEGLDGQLHQTLTTLGEAKGPEGLLFYYRLPSALEHYRDRLAQLEQQEIAASLAVLTRVYQCRGEEPERIKTLVTEFGAEQAKLVSHINSHLTDLSQPEVVEHIRKLNQLAGELLNDNMVNAYEQNQQIFNRFKQYAKPAPLNQLNQLYQKIGASAFVEVLALEVDIEQLKRAIERERREAEKLKVVYVDRPMEEQLFNRLLDVPGVTSRSELAIGILPFDGDQLDREALFNGLEFTSASSKAFNSAIREPKNSFEQALKATGQHYVNGVAFRQAVRERYAIRGWQLPDSPPENWEALIRNWAIATALRMEQRQHAIDRLISCRAAENWPQLFAELEAPQAGTTRSE